MTFSERAGDWRIGATVYQIFVDRFAPPESLDAGRTLRGWNEFPEASEYLPGVGYPHTREFWGGNLAGITDRLEHVARLADTLYLTPIFDAASNHKYDTSDYERISPEFGTPRDFERLIDQAHAFGLKVVLDGVFNHMGARSPRFESARLSPESPFRDWFRFDERFPGGYEAWYGIADLPALNLDNPDVRDYLWRGEISIVKRYLRAGIDGWRLDVAYDLGPEIPREIRDAARAVKPECLIVGEIVGYPAGWESSVDAVFNFTYAELAKACLDGEISGGRMARILERLVADAGIENLLRAWTHLDNHDTPRAASAFPDPMHRRIAWALLFSLPGAPVVYYGSEFGLAGDGDPRNRAPMPWQHAADNNPDFAWVNELVAFRRRTPALRHGDLRVCDGEKSLAFLRVTDRLRETVFVIVNPTDEPVTETILVPDGRLMSWGELRDPFSGDSIRVKSGLARVSLPPFAVRFFQPVTETETGYSPFARIP